MVGPVINAMTKAVGQASTQAFSQRAKKSGAAPRLIKVIHRVISTDKVNDIIRVKARRCFMMFTDGQPQSPKPTT